MSVTLRVEGLENLVRRHDAFVLDQWGVLHDGNHLYPGVMEFLGFVRNAEKQTVILTNSSKSADRNMSRLEEVFGLPRASYHDLISSAQLLRDHLTGRTETIFVVADEGDEVIVRDLGLPMATSAGNADLVVLLSSKPDQGVDEHMPWIETAQNRGLPILCPSADTHSVRPTGIVLGMSAIVEECQKRGVPVTNFGKPSTHIYQHCRSVLDGIAPDRVVAVGDQIPSDIVGGRDAGWVTVLVETGAGSKSLSLADEGDLPDFIVPELRL